MYYYDKNLRVCPVLYLAFILLLHTHPLYNLSNQSLQPLRPFRCAQQIPNLYFRRTLSPQPPLNITHASLLHRFHKPNAVAVLGVPCRILSNRLELNQHFQKPLLTSI